MILISITLTQFGINAKNKLTSSCLIPSDLTARCNSSLFHVD